MVGNFDKWKAALQAKLEKKEADVLLAKQRKERMMEELREQFGFYIDPRDERFKEMLEQKEKEDKKKKKELKKQKKAERMMLLLKKAEDEMKARESQNTNENQQSGESENEVKLDSSDKKKGEKMAE